MPGARRLAAVAAIPLTLVAGAAIVYWSGGTSYAWPYVLFVPVLIGAALFGLPGGAIVAVGAGFALGPFMPLDVDAGTWQSTENWLTRLAFFVVIGSLAGGMFQRLRTVSRRDPVTGLANQIALEANLANRLTQVRLRRGGEGTSVALVRASDIDEVLDAIGADAGDEIIAGLAERLSARLPVRRVYRYSASSFALLFDTAEEGRLREHAHVIRDIGDETLTIRDIPVRIELCCGMAASATGEEAPHELIRRARVAVAVALRRERDLAFYTEGDERQSMETVRLVARLRDALDQHEFELHYQPRVGLDPDDAEGDRVESVEALIRWRSPDGGLIPPGRFVGKVERTRLIVPLTRFVAQRASAFARDHPGLRISLNLAPRTLQDEELVASLIATVADSGVDPARLEFEVTESALMTDPATSIRTLERLRELGAGVSIDDFGTGYASFEYLRHLPVTGLKIDKTFLCELTVDARTRDLVRCMIEVGQGLGLRVTAEGAESGEAVESLRTLGCDAVQGFVYTPALPEAELLD